ncbi:unnamed protein product [Nippostrongylus brasiliensis]|uniref:EB domain-containing protein n=1 Tax=Nippostrongylus brasiliensis TaxID=27835 RepID=A0A0N4YLX5_NIPBR|nr:unnamed protein product [Nippostrongylus brasiliensis]
MLLYIGFVVLCSTIICLQASQYTPCNGKSAIGGVCDVNSDCEHKGSICLRNRCRCHPHYAEANDEKGGRNIRCVPLPAKVGASCTNKCREPLFCRNGECQCVQRGTTRISNGECVTRKSAIGGVCDVNSDCEHKGSICLRNRCRCHPHYAEANDEKGGRNIRCVPLPAKVGASCTNKCREPLFCRNGECQCVQRGTTRISNGECGSRCVAAANCPLGGLPGQRCVIKTEPALAFNLPSDQDDCPPGQYCVAAADSPVGHCCPVVCPLATHVDTKFSCDPNSTSPMRCPSDTHFCHLLSDGLVSQAVCCRRPCNALAPNALYANNECIPRGQLNSACTTNAQCGGGEAQLPSGQLGSGDYKYEKVTPSSSLNKKSPFQSQCQCLSGFHPSVDSLTHPMKNPSQMCSRDCESEALSKDTSCMKASYFPVVLEVSASSNDNVRKILAATEVVVCAVVDLSKRVTVAIIPGVAVPRGNDLFKLFGQIFGGNGASNAIGSFING